MHRRGEIDDVQAARETRWQHGIPDTDDHLAAFPADIGNGSRVGQRDQQPAFPGFAAPEIDIADITVRGITTRSHGPIHDRSIVRRITLVKWGCPGRPRAPIAITLQGENNPVSLAIDAIRLAGLQVEHQPRAAGSLDDLHILDAGPLNSDGFLVQPITDPRQVEHDTTGILGLKITRQTRLTIQGQLEFKPIAGQQGIVHRQQPIGGLGATQPDRHRHEHQAHDPRSVTDPPAS